jgi:hypothetical protein
MSLAVLAYAISCILAAAFVRGYSGFGFSLLAISAISLVLPTATVVPAIFLLEIAASIHLLPQVWKDIHWRSLLPLLLGSVVGTPAGLWFLANAPQPPMKIALAIFVFASVLLLWRGFALRSIPGRMASGAAGLAAGVANGAFGIGGPPVILFYFASPAGAAAGRASLIAYFLMLDAIGLTFMAPQGLIGRESLWLAALFLPTLLAGVWLGARSFRAANAETFRRWVLAILAILSLLILAQGFEGLSA